MGELLQELHSFFQQDAFNLDLERAVFFYQGFTKSEKKMEEAEAKNFGRPSGIIFSLIIICY